MKSTPTKRPAPAQMSDMDLHVVFYREDGGWYGHCLEFDLVELGTTLDDAKRNILDVVKAHVEWAMTNDNLDNLFRFAPIEFWKRFWSGRPLGTETISIDVEDDLTIPPVWQLKEAASDAYTAS